MNDGKKPNGSGGENGKAQSPSAKELLCGIIMPISAIDGASAEHWSEVKPIITEAVASIEAPRFTTKLVSDADEVGVIRLAVLPSSYGVGVDPKGETTR